MIEITNETYTQIADLLRSQIGNAEWFNGSVEFENDFFHARLTLSAIVYRRNETLPEGKTRPIDDIVPVWSDCATTLSDGTPVVNDFTFSELKPHVVDYD
jgi:hypothetical protein